MNSDKGTNGLYLDDLQVGQQFRSGDYLMTAERMKSFALEFDPQPFHLDETAAETSIFRGLAASGWHTAAATMRMMADGGVPFANGLIGLGGEILWPRPTRAGDCLHVISEIIEITPSRSKPQQAIVKVRIATINQKDEEVQVFTAKILAHKRPAETMIGGA